MSKNIAAFGEVMMRLQVPGFKLLSQEATLEYSFSGTGINVTAALAKFGHTAHLISTLPRNPIGDAALAHIRKLGIQTGFVNRDGNYLGMYFLENGFGARPSRVTYSNRQESSFNTAQEENYRFNKIAVKIDIIHFCGITLAMNDNVRRQMKSFAKAVRKHGGTIVFDCNYRPALWGDAGYEQAKPHYEEMLHLADIVLMNEKDAKFILGMETTKENRTEQLVELIPAVSTKYNIPLIAGTQRSINDDHTHSLQGFIYKKGLFSFSKTMTFSVLDRIGAGDAFTSGIIHGEINGFSSDKAVNFAAAAAVLAHTVVGDTPMAAENEIYRAMGDTNSDLDR